jgi:adenine-specific DNA-methyltransferase
VESITKEKSLGQYFTPNLIVKFMIKLISEGRVERRILEPSAGKGVFLKRLIDEGFQSVTGIEIDPKLTNGSPIPIKVGNFFDVPIKEKFDIVIGNPPYIRWKNLTLESREYFSSSSFWKKRMNGLTDILQPFIFKSVDHLRTGGELIFISPSFWMQTLHAEPLRRFLLSQGVLELVINFNEAKIFSNVSSNLIIFKFRKHTGEQFSSINPLRIINFQQKKSVTPETTNRILWLLRRPSIWDFNAKEDEKIPSIKFFKTVQPVNSQPWRFLPKETEIQLSRFEKSCYYSPKLIINGHKLRLSSLYTKNDLYILGIPKKLCKRVKYGNKTYFRHPQVVPLTKYQNKSNKISSSPSNRFIRIDDIVEIGNGMVSGLDKAFRVNNFSQSLNEKEKKLIIPVVKAKSIRRYYVDSTTDYFLVRSGDIPSEEILKQEYPSLYSHLIPYREALEARYQYNRQIPFWEWVFLRNYALMKDASQLICVPCKDRFDSRGYLRFALCENGNYSTQDVTILVKLGWVNESLEYITSFLNSAFVYEWVINKGLIRGGVAEFSEKPLSRVPFRLINFNDPNEKEIHNTITAKVREIRHRRIEDIENIMEINNLISRLIKS